MISLEFSTTAMVRPKILSRTYSSFCKRLRGVDFSQCTLYLNVDPLPAEDDPMAVVEMAKRYFGNVVHRIPENPNFTAAVQWCWSQVTGPYVFHLEDDWILRRDIIMKEMIKQVTGKYKERRVIQVFLRAYPHLDRRKVCLSPSLLSGDFVRKASEIFDISLNPEIQLRGDIVTGFSINHSKDICVHDIGRVWMRKSGYKRPDKKARFNRWIKK